MKYGIIATWCMSFDGVCEAYNMLKENKLAADAIISAIEDVENCEFYKSVGYGGLPNEEMIVELDAGYMDGTSFDIGMVGAIKNFKNPVKIAKHLSKLKANNFLVGTGAEKYATRHNFESKNMLTKRAQIHYYNRLYEINQQPNNNELKPYNGHDTVGMVCIDQNNVISATSTSGLFMKHAGRLGDSPVVGSGFYADSEIGGCSATGLGEDMMKTCVSFQVVELMSLGKTPQESCQIVVEKTINRLKKAGRDVGDISLIAMDNEGNWGCCTNIDNFSFVVATDQIKPTIYLAKFDENKKIYFEKATQEWIDNYINTRKKPLEKKYE